MTSKDINRPESGFYYDNQLNNPMLRVTLHPSTEEDDNAPEFSHKVTDTLPDDGFYRKTPICQSIISEDFQVSISNNLNNFGGDAIGDFWTSAISPLAPYVDFVGKDLGTLVEKGGSAIGRLLNKVASGATSILGAEEDTKSKVNNVVGNLSNKITNITGDVGRRMQNNEIYASAIMGRKLVVQGTMFSYYAGTGFDFGNLGMKFTIFSGYDSNGKFKSVEQQVKDLKFYIVGPWIDVGKDTKVRDFADFMSSFLYWQLPPGGFKTAIKNVDEKCYGTLKLIIGPFYALENLIIRGATFNYSKTLCKDPDNVGEIHPLSCEINLVLQPVTKFSGDFMFAFAHGERTTQYRKEILEKMKTDLQAIKNKTDNPSGINKM